MSEPMTLNTDNDNKSKPSSSIIVTKNNIISSNTSFSQKTHNDDICNDPNLLRFSNSYSSLLYIIVDSIDKKLHPGKLHLIQIGKLLHKLVNGITEIKPIGVRIRLSFDNIYSANAFLTSKTLENWNLQASIPASL